MIAWLWGPFEPAVTLGWTGPRVLRSAHPRMAVQLGAAISLVVAVSTGVVLAAAAELAVAQARPCMRSEAWGSGAHRRRRWSSV